MNYIVILNQLIIKKEPVDYNFSTQLTDLNNNFEIENTNIQLEKKTDKKLIPPQINLNTKEKNRCKII